MNGKAYLQGNVHLSDFIASWEAYEKVAKVSFARIIKDIQKNRKEKSSKKPDLEKEIEACRAEANKAIHRLEKYGDFEDAATFCSKMREAFIEQTQEYPAVLLRG